MIDIKNLNKNFKEKVIFKNFSCSIKDGEFVIISGPSGKGKTTILNIIGGIESFDSGSVIVNGISLNDKKKIIELYREEIAFLFQSFALVEDKTVEENLNLIEKKYRSNVDMKTALDKVGLLGFESRKIYTLSGGEQQRVAIARLFMKKCNIILADEPTGSLDKKNADMVMQYLWDLNQLGKTVVIVTHNEEYKKTGGRVIEL